MAVVGIFYGTETGHTKRVAEMIREQMGHENVELHDVGVVPASELDRYPMLIFGVPTGERHEPIADWQMFLRQMDTVDLQGKAVAVFGLGDQVEYSDHFVDALGVVAERLRERGARLVGSWHREGYHFLESRALDGGGFVGLVIDEDNQTDLTSERVDRWCRKVQAAFGWDKH